jgi:MFS-type transporter involved in bile tolerance (Atg22 family)
MKYASMGTQLFVIMAVFTFGGYYLDHRLGLKIPVLTVVLSLIGIAAAFYLTLKDLLRDNKKKH